MNQNLWKTDSIQHGFLLTIHDWIAHLTHTPYRWNDYGTTLTSVLLEKMGDEKTQLIPWVVQVGYKPLTIKSLLYRHYLARQVLALEVQSDSNAVSLYTLIAAMLTQEIVFSPIDVTFILRDIENVTHPINSLRANRPFIQTFIDKLADRDDDTPYQLIHDHGLLSSVLLIYGLYLTHVILVYEMTVRPSEALSVILKSSMHTLILLKGVLNHVENQWFIPHVQ